MFIFKVIHSFLVEITSYFKGNPKSFEPPILRTETLVPESCTYKYSFFGNRNPFMTSLSLFTQKKNQTHRAFSWGWWKLKLSSFWGSIWSFVKGILNFLVDITFYFTGNPQSFEPPKYKAVLRSILWCSFEVQFSYFQRNS